MSSLQAPFPWFGGKRRVAPEVWERFGDVPNYVEPFFGSGAVLLGRPSDHAAKIETVNDLDGFVANFWRAVSLDPETTAGWADWPVNEVDLNARHAYLVAIRDRLRMRLEGDPDYFDPRIAGWWVAGVCGWIGSGYCSGDGPWRVIDGEMVDQRRTGHQPPDADLSNAGRGINRQMPTSATPDGASTARCRTSGTVAKVFTARCRSKHGSTHSLNACATRESPPATGRAA